MVSFRIIQLVQISKENTWKMHKIHDTIMDIFMESLTLIYQFLMFQAMILIQEPSLMSQQDNGIVILAWIALEPSFQFWKICQKTQTW